MSAEALQDVARVAKGLESQRSRLSILSLFKGLTGRLPALQMAAKDLSELTSGMFLVAGNLPVLAQEETEDTAESAAEFAAECFEHFADLGGTLLTTEQLPMELYSSVLYLMAGKNANAALLAQRLGTSQPEDRLTDPAQLRPCLLRLWELLLRKDFSQLAEEARALHADLGALLAEGEYDLGELLLLTYAARVCDAMVSVAALMREPETEQRERLEQATRDAMRAAELLGTGQWLFLAEALEAVARRSSRYSIRRRLAQDDVLARSDYLDALTSGDAPIYELWKPQLQALDRGLLDHPTFSVSLPTSAGKTFLAELKIARTLLENPGALVLYVAPFNALAKQVQRDLQTRLRHPPLRLNIKVLTGSYEIPDDQLAAVKKEDVIVTTPEKLDALFRSRTTSATAARLFDRLKLVVLDECQLIGSGVRGIRYEMLIARLKTAFPETAFLSLAASFANVSEFAEWLSGDAGSCFASDWRPTRLHHVVWRKGDEGPVYDGGWRITGLQRGDSPFHDAIGLALELQKSYENVLLMVDTKRAAQRTAADICRLLTTQQKESVQLTSAEVARLRQAAALIREETQPGFLLAEYVELGVAYHHSALPGPVKTELETLIDAGTIKLVASTTTLAEGMNFPIRCVILPKIWFWSGPISPIQFNNIKGRAGRAFKSTSGQVIILPGGKFGRVLYKGQWYSASRLYFDTPAHLLQVGSSLVAVTEDTGSLEAAKLADSLDSALLAFILDGTVPAVDGQAEFMWQRTYASKLATDLSAAVFEPRLAAMAQERRPSLVAASPYQATAFGEAVNATGYSSYWCNVLGEYLEGVVAERPSIFERVDLSCESAPESLTLLVCGVFLLPDLVFDSLGVSRRARALFGEPRTRFAAHARDRLADMLTARVSGAVREAVADEDMPVLWSWLQGMEIADIATRCFLAKGSAPGHAEAQEARDRAFMDAVQYVGKLRTTFRWGFFALRTVAEYLAVNEGAQIDRSFMDGFAHCLDTGTSSWLAATCVRRCPGITRAEADRIADAAEHPLRWCMDIDVGIDWLRRFARTQRARKLLGDELTSKFKKGTSVLPQEWGMEDW